MEETQKQYKKQYDWLKGYQFVKGQSGNPGGKKKGTKSLKTFAREYLESLPDEEKLAFLEVLPEELVFRMAEGNPATKLQGDVDEPITIRLVNYNGNNNSVEVPSEKLSTGTPPSPPTV